MKWKDTREKLGADLEGGMTNSLLNASKILQGESYVEQDAKAPKVPTGE